MTESPRPARRRVPILAFGAGGALVALGFGIAIENMRLGPPLVMVALGGMTLAFTAAALWRVIDPLTRLDAGPGGSAEQRPRRGRELEREKQLVLKAIKEIELDYQMRKIADRDYREMVERYRSRALRLIGELEAGDDFRALIERELKIRLELPQPESPKPSAPVGANPASCPSCQTINDPDAQFCKKCGAKL